MYAEIIHDFLKKESDNWSHETIIDIIKNSATDRCKVLLPNVVILRPGKNPNCNANVHAACKMYFDDVGTENSDYIDVVCDKVIFCHLIPFKEKKSKM